MNDMPKSAITWYRTWIGLFPETGDEEEGNLERFYMFVHVLLTYSRKDRSPQWLEKRLKEDCKGRLSDEMIEKYCDLYQKLKAFKNVWKSQQAKLIALSIHEQNMAEAKKKYS